MKTTSQFILVNIAMIVAGCSTAHIPGEAVKVDSEITNATWLSSTCPEVTLGVTDKNGTMDLNELKPVFVVTGPTGEKYSASSSYSGPANHAGVVFPYNFNSDYWPLVGRYSWRCFVQSNCIAWGEFEYHESPPSASVINEEN